MFNSSIFSENNAFVPYEGHHYFALLFFFTLGVILIVSGRLSKETNQILIGKIYASVLSFIIIIWTIIKIVLDDFDLKTDLPFHLCNLIALLMPIYAFTRKKVMYEILLFWVFTGTIQALFTPDLNNGFPHFTYIKYWFAHAGVVVFMLYATFVYNHKPDVKSIFKSYIALQIYVGFVCIVNLILDSNYFYINKKPNATTLLDMFGDWPYYIIVAELILIPFFFMVYLPFYLSKRIKA